GPSAARRGHPILLVDLKEGKERVLPGHEHPAHTACFSPDGRTLATGVRLGPDNQPLRGEIILHDVSSGGERKRIRWPLTHDFRLAFSSDGARVIAQGGLGHDRAWDVATGTPSGFDLVSLPFLPDLPLTHRLRVSEHLTRCVVAPNGRRFA